jgi:drug/metabolite transporter (DMT)-like permease
MTIAGALFAAMNAFAHQAAAEAPIAVVAGARASVGAIISFLFAIFAKRAPFRPFVAQAYLGANRPMWGRTLFGTAAMACTFFALGDQRLPLGDAATLFNLSPLLVAFIAPFLLDEPTDRRLAWTLPLALAGVLAILRPSFLWGGTHTSVPTLPVFVAVLAAFFASFAMVLLRSTRGETPEGFSGTIDSVPRTKQSSAEAVALHFSSFAAVVFLAFAYFSGAFATFSSWNGSVPSMLGAGVSAGCAQLAMTAAYRRDGAARVAALGYLNVPMSALLGAVLHRQWPTLFTFVGMMLIVGSGLVGALMPRRKSVPLARNERGGS